MLPASERSSFFLKKLQSAMSVHVRVYIVPLAIAAVYCLQDVHWMDRLIIGLLTGWLERDKPFFGIICVSFMY